MVNRERIVNEFIELAQIDSLSLKERKMADVLKKKLESMGLSVYEDDAGSKIGGNTGNLICTLKGKKDVSPIILMAHMDTVVPGIGKKPVIEGNMIKSDGSTILGGDDVAGIECILEAIRVLKEQGAEHGDVQIVFTVAEEIGLLGTKNLDYEKIFAQYGFVLDHGKRIGNVAVSAPTQNNFTVVIKGKAAHAGMEPEKGISAIQIASHAISSMKLGRIDNETTANIGIISGGLATNIVCETVQIKAEARSRDERKLEEQTNHMRECFKKAAALYGGMVDFKYQLMYPAFNIKENEEIINILKKASVNAGIELKLEGTGGGSDTNILNGRGIQSVDLSVGLDKVHSVEEQICINDLIKTTEFVVEIVKAVI